jgi:hypothetical protein
MGPGQGTVDRRPQQTRETPAACTDAPRVHGVGVRLTSNFVDQVADCEATSLRQHTRGLGSFEVTLPAIDPPSPMSVTVPRELVASLEAGDHEFEVLAIEQGGNQTITSDSFTK